MQQIKTVSPQEYSWRSEESELISSILGSAQERGVENGPMRAAKALLRGFHRGSALGNAPKPIGRTQANHLEGLVASLTEEIKNHRSEIRELQMLVQHVSPDLLSSVSSRSRGPWWRKWLLRLSY